MATIKHTILIVSFTAFILAILKLIFAVISGSVVILASAIDSLFDVLFSLLNFFAIKKIESPSNRYFNYGYGKLEGFASLFEGVFIFISGIYIIYRSIIKFINNEGINDVNQGLFIMMVSIILTAIIVIYLNMISKKQNNLILQAEILHYKTDLLSNLAIIISLFIVKFSGFEEFDSIVGVLLGIYICFNAFKIAKKAFFMLLDRSIDDKLFTSIVDILDKNDKIASYHDFKSRISGNTIFLSCHLVFDDNISLFDAHSISNDIEKSIENLSDEYKWAILIHLDPYDDSI
ncbi:cation diffusion facilitator family transporter [Helicobacter sp. MIT 99-5507]|uniref:cation diffusion facilitator family transporter n=1 Tax=Helicobacter sp. MIT 99-5507 TaxID=152489 RepID=UPI000E1E7282|nr:cation diffusion facilitator family transporter [Helicobacter sp. MIT 99-5507]RDU57257.1 cation transporter [Helicobacter sp. MIT 99-5507]